jgi:hypothetical protein
MTAEFLLILAAGAAAGGLINGLAGFGTALFGLGFWLQIMDPVQAVAVAIFMSVATGLQGAWLVRRSIMDQPRRLAGFVVPGLVGIPLGVAALSFLHPGYLKITIAAMMILYGGFFTVRRTLPRLEHSTPVIDGCIGFLGGIMGGAISLSGALPTMWSAMKIWSKSETRAVLQPFNIVILGVTGVVLLFRGVYTLETMTHIAVALPVALFFAQTGIALFKRLTDDQFRQLLVAMMFLSGTILLAKEVL